MTICFKDKTFCQSPNCKNKCGRKMTEVEKKQLESNPMAVCYGYFCGDPENVRPNRPTKRKL